jgi:hypothetical protein
MDELLAHVRRTLDGEVHGWEPQPHPLPAVRTPRIRTTAGLVAGLGVIAVGSTLAIGVHHGNRPRLARLEVQASPPADTTIQVPVHVVAYQYARVGVTPIPGDLEATHVTGPVQYAVSPPVGGPHNPTWLNCGTYGTTPPTVNAVHDLEHGAVWITYRSDISDADQAALKNIAATQADVTLDVGTDNVNTHEKYMDLFPFEDQPSPVVLTSWGHQLALSSPSDPRIQQFIGTFRAAEKYTPEYGASCAGGIGTPEG